MQAPCSISVVKIISMIAPENLPPQPWRSPDNDVETMWRGCCEPDGYGELSRKSVDTLFQTLGLTPASPTKAFYDLGSGVGKIVMHAAIGGYAKQAVGVELNDGRHRSALSLLESVKIKDPRAASAITLLNADMLDVDLSSATVLYLNHACFPENVREALTQKILDTAHKAEIIVAAPTIPRLTKSGLFYADPDFLMLDMEMYSYGTVSHFHIRPSRRMRLAAAQDLSPDCRFPCRLSQCTGLQHSRIAIADTKQPRLVHISCGTL